MKKRIIIFAVTAVVVILAVLFKVISTDSIVNIEHRQIPTIDLDVITMESGEVLSVPFSHDAEEFEGGVYALTLNINGGQDIKSNYSANGFALDISFPQDEYVEMISAYYCDDERAYEVTHPDFGYNEPHHFSFTSEGDYLRSVIVFKTKPKEIKATLRYNIEGKGFRLLNHYYGQQMELEIK